MVRSEGSSCGSVSVSTWISGTIEVLGAVGCENEGLGDETGTVNVTTLLLTCCTGEVII